MQKWLGLFPPTGRIPLAEVPPLPQFFAKTVEKNKGRIEIRTIETTSLLTCFEVWKGLQQGFRITRTITTNQKTTTEVVHGITSLSEAQADAGRLLELLRNHWSIENQLHYVRDVTLGEDACRVRSGHAPQVLAGIRNVLVYLLNQQPEESKPEAIQRFAARVDEALNLLKDPNPNSL